MELEPASMGVFAMRELGVFAKYWQAGQVKTRLAQSIGDDLASRFYRYSLGCSLQRFAMVADQRVLAYTPQQSQAEFRAIASDAWQLEPQSEGDLGERMRHFFACARQSGAGRTVLIGSDSPTLPVEIVEQAFDRLASHGVVLGPSDDGGYYLIGVSGELPPIFDRISWSTSLVFQQTTERLEAVDWDYAVLPEWYDVDDLRGLTRLGNELKAASADTAAMSDLRCAVSDALVEARWRGVL